MQGMLIVKVKSFEDYRRQVLAELRRRQQLAEQEAARRALQRQKRRVASPRGFGGWVMASGWGTSAFECL
eukprot:Skav211765  [mRNA]  locus=scaffold674:416870:422172:+ [translate_table: standard]